MTTTAQTPADIRAQRDLGFFRAGERVWFRGRFADQYSVRGVIEDVISVGPGVRYSVRLENGNHMFAEPNQVRERGL